MEQCEVNALFSGPPNMSNSALVVARRVRAVGSRVLLAVIIAACSGDDGDIDAPGPIPVPVASVSIVSQSASVLVNDSIQLSAIAFSAGGDSLTGRTVVWSSDSPWIANVDASGRLAAYAMGTAWISATIDGVMATAPFTVRLRQTPVVTTLTPHEISAGYPGVFTLRVTGEGFKATSRISFAGAVHDTRYVSGTELQTTITPDEVITPGLIEVAVETPGADGGRVTGTFTVHARPTATLDIETVSGGFWTWVRDRHTMRAVPRNADGDVLGDRIVTWSSSNANVANALPASVHDVGVWGVAPGTATITASIDGKTATRQIAVYAAPAYDLVMDLLYGTIHRLAIWTPGTGSIPAPLYMAIANLDAVDPSPSPDGGQIVFTGTRAGETVPDLYVVNRDGSGLHVVAPNAGVDYTPAWSPDGSRIAFTSTRDGYADVWTMKPDGTDLRKLTNGNPANAGGTSPAWSPDGARIAYVSTSGASSDIWVMNADGSNKRQLTSTAEQDVDPVWSPDGNAITFRRTGGPSRRLMLFSVSPVDGSPVYSFTDYGDGAMPAYSPDGRYLTFTRPGTAATGASLVALPLLDMVGPRTIVGPTGGAYGVEPSSVVWMRRP